MNEANFQELKDLILELKRNTEIGFIEADKKMQVGFAELDKKMEVGFAEIRAEIKEVRGEVKLVEERLTGRINQVEEKLGGIDQRIGNEELISRGVFIALVGGVVTGLTKFFFFS